tara:strand:- start:216 stop:395 length:180 start_codon:yes stop_codon:yes gene_type:complete
VVQAVALVKQETLEVTLLLKEIAEVTLVVEEQVVLVVMLQVKTEEQVVQVLHHQLLVLL